MTIPCRRSRRHLAFLVSAALLAVAARPAPARSQIRASELGTISQTVDGTVIALEYSRPRLRGRTGIFGSPAVHWGESWTPGANWATTLDVNRDVTIEGRPLAKGRYSVWMVVRASGEWTLLLDPRAKRFHMNPPDSTGAQVRIPIRPQHGPATEVLTWSFPDVRASGATLVMSWDTVRVALDLRVTPTLAVTTAEAEGRPIVGVYDVVTQDSSSHTRQLIVTYEHGTLRGDLVPQHPYFTRFALIKVAPDTYVMGLYDKGEIYEVLRSDMTFAFSHSPGRAASVEMRAEDDSLWWSGTRKP
jgi:hypothetical protein